MDTVHYFWSELLFSLCLCMPVCVRKCVRKCGLSPSKCAYAAADFYPTLTSYVHTPELLFRRRRRRAPGRERGALAREQLRAIVALMFTRLLDVPCAAHLIEHPEMSNALSGDRLPVATRGQRKILPLDPDL